MLPGPASYIPNTNLKSRRASSPGYVIKKSILRNESVYEYVGAAKVLQPALMNSKEREKFYNYLVDYT